MALHTRILIDLGSTFTKAVAVDLETGTVIATAKSPSTVQQDVSIGLTQALAKLPPEAGIADAEIIACSSAAGGLRMVSIGLVPELSAEAATRAALGAGAKMVGHYSYKLGREELRQIEEKAPDIILLAGGTDGGNEAAIVHNAGILARSRLSVPVVVAGNKCAYDHIGEIFADSALTPRFVANVMPEIGRLEVQACREAIREVFMDNIVRAKGLDRARQIANHVIMPTPAAVLNAAALLSLGTANEPGLGEIIAIDVGGATTDVYSVAKGTPSRSVVRVKGLPEPFAKRTVEGDLGVRHNLDSLLHLCRAEDVAVDEAIASDFRHDPGRLPRNEPEMALDAALARMAVKTSFERHVGRLETVYGPHGEMLVQTGKDLSEVATVIGTGGPLAYSPCPHAILSAVLPAPEELGLLKPKKAKFYVDKQYVMYAAGLLAATEPNAALRIMKQSLTEIPAAG
jgi:uncharacterized protein (TIGR01319 family)